jgi:hypothetical protein
MKRILKIAALVIGLLVIVAVGTIASAFVGRQSIRDGFEINGIRIVKDGIVSVSFVPIGAGEVALIDAGNDKSGSRARRRARGHAWSLDAFHVREPDWREGDANLAGWRDGDAGSATRPRVWGARSYRGKRSLSGEWRAVSRRRSRRDQRWDNQASPVDLQRQPSTGSSLARQSRSSPHSGWE